MSQRGKAGNSGRAAFLTVAVAATVAAVGQVVLGGVVRVTGSGLGCPDWPLCHGRIVPPFELEVLIEYAHRLSATVLGLLVLVVTGLAWRYHRPARWIIASSTAALALVVLAAILGGITVWTELAWWIVLIHLGLAELVVASLVVVCVLAWNTGREVEDQAYADGPGRHDLIVLTALLGTFAVILSGSYMVGLGYGSVCGTWPLCKGSILPGGEAFAVHMAHRIAASLAGVLIAGTALSAWSRKDRRPELWWASLLACGIFLLQALTGAITVWTGFSAYLKSIHLSMGTLLWASLVLLAALNLTRWRLQLRALGGSLHAGPGPERVVT